MLFGIRVVLSALLIVHSTLYGQTKADFPDGFDAVQAEQM
jgi:hypothetical protein